MSHARVFWIVFSKSFASLLHLPDHAKLRFTILVFILRAANELGKKTVAVYAEEDKLGLHRFKADEAYRIPDAIMKKVLKDEPPNLQRPGKHFEPVDLEAVRQQASDALDGIPVDNEDLNGYLMYPKVFIDYMQRHAIYGPVRTLPTHIFFYGMQPGEEISAEIDPGKTCPKPEVGNPDHIGAPMPGVVASLAVSAGQKVKEGDLLLTIEAMKMETGIHADRSAIVKTVHVQSGSQIDAKDLLIELE